MKVFVFALAVLVAGAAAAPEDANQARFVDGVVSRVIEEVAQNVRDRGLDPYVRQNDSFKFKLPVTDLLIVEAALESFAFEGLSNIHINQMHFSLLTFRLDYDIEFPLISVRIGSAQGYAKFFDRETGASLNGDLNVYGTRVQGRAVVRIGLTGVYISSLTVNFSVKDIKSDFQAVIHSWDISENLNWALAEYIPYVLNNSGNDINKLLEHFIRQILDERL